MTLETLALIAPVGTIVAVALAVFGEEYFNQREMKRERLAAEGAHPVADADPIQASTYYPPPRVFQDAGQLPAFWTAAYRNDFPAGFQHVMCHVASPSRPSRLQDWAVYFMGRSAIARGVYFSVLRAENLERSLRSLTQANREIEQAVQALQSEITSNSRSAAETSKR